MDMLSPVLDKKAMDMLSPVLDKKAMDMLRAMEMLNPLLHKKAMDMLSPFLTPVFQLTKNVMQEDEVYEILQADLRPINNLLLDIAILFPDPSKEDWEALKIWFQLLHNCLTQAINILHRYGPSQRQRRLDCVNCRPGRLLKRVKEWKLEFDYIFQGLQSDFSMFVDKADQIINTDPTPALRAEESGVLTRSAEELEEESGDPTLRAEELKEESGDPTRSAEEAAEELEEESAEEPVEEAAEELEEESAEEAVEELEEEAVELEEESGVPTLSAEESEEESGDPTLSAEEAAEELEEESRDPTRSAEEPVEAAVEELEEESGDPGRSAEESVERLCEDEAWMVFERIAFREKGAPVDIKGCARNIAEECKGFPLAIRLVAAAMRGKTTVDEWNISLSSIKNSSSYPQATLHPQRLYQLLRWCYDALPNSDIKNCFLYCAMYPKHHEINVQELVRMWIGEGLVRSKQESHSMDMAIGRRYLNLLLDRCFIQNPPAKENLWSSNWGTREKQCIRVEDDIHEMAIYIGEKEENCLLKAGSGLQNFPTIHNHADCKRISLLHNDDIQNLPSELPCPKLVSLFLSCVSIAKVPSGFLVSLTSLKVLHLVSYWYSNRINSIPSSVGQLKQLEFLSLKELPEEIKELPEEMCHLPFLQFLDLYDCIHLESLPSKIGELQNLKYLSLNYCFRLKEIPHEISQLTSLTTLDLGGVGLSVEADQSEVPLSVGADQSEARSTRSIWRLKGFTNLRELRLSVHGKVPEGIMGTWLEMRRLRLGFPDNGNMVGDEALALPRDMKEMRKLQSFDLMFYKGSSLPDYACNFRHLENIWLCECRNLREVSPLERLPNLKCLSLDHCTGLKELGTGSSGSRFLMLEKLVLSSLWELESIAGESSSNESTLPSLRILKIRSCRKLKRFPVGMDRLLNLSTIYGEQEWWDQIIWEDDAMKAHLQKLFRAPPY